jgi:Reverse transcriptase (RNA-dependent DNA polymerase)
VYYQPGYMQEAEARMSGLLPDSDSEYNDLPSLINMYDTDDEDDHNTPDYEDSEADEPISLPVDYVPETTISDHDSDDDDDIPGLIDDPPDSESDDDDGIPGLVADGSDSDDDDDDAPVPTPFIGMADAPPTRKRQSNLAESLHPSQLLANQPHWTCSTCTFEQLSSTANRCEMCLTPSPMTHDRRFMSQQESATRRAARFHRELHQPSPSRHSRPSTTPPVTLRGALFPQDEDDENQRKTSRPTAEFFLPPDGFVDLSFRDQPFAAAAIPLGQIADWLRQIRAMPNDTAAALDATRLLANTRELIRVFDSAITVHTTAHFTDFVAATNAAATTTAATTAVATTAVDDDPVSDLDNDDASTTDGHTYMVLPCEESHASTRIALDSGATLSLFELSLMRYAHHLRPTNKRFQGISGALSASSVGSLGLLSDVYFADVPRSLISMSAIDSVNTSIIHQPQRLEVYMRVHPHVHVLQFDLEADGLYSMTFDKFLNSCNTPSLAPIPDALAFPSLSGFTNDEIRRAKEARKFHEVLGHTGRAQELEHLRRGTFSNHTVTAIDLTLSDSVLGSCPVCLRCKVFAKSRVQPRDLVPTSLIGHTQYVDVMFLKLQSKTLPTWICVDQATQKTIVSSPQPESTRDATSFAHALAGVNAYYQKFNHSAVKRIFSDNEGALIKHEAAFNATGGQIFFRSRAEHEHVVERYIGIFKSTMRTLVHSLPYNFSPKWMRWLTHATIQRMSLRSNHLTRGVPIVETIEGFRLDYSRLVPFGAFGYSPNPAVKPDTDDYFNQPVIVFGSRLNGSKNYTCLSLATMEIVSRNKVKFSHITQEFINLLNSHSDSSTSRTDFVDTVILGHNSYEPSADDPAFNPDENPMPPAPSALSDVPTPILMQPARTRIATPLRLAPPLPVPILPPSIPAPAPASVSFDPTEQVIPAVPELPVDAPCRQPRLRREPVPPPPPMTTRSRTRAAALADLLLEEHEGFHPIGSALGLPVAFKALISSNMSYKKAHVLNPDKTDNANRKEMLQMVNRDIFRPVLRSTLSPADFARTIRGHTFFKLKGDNVKARFVAGGQDVNKDELGDISSPTGKLESLMLLLGVAALHEFSVTTMDITAAYLNTRLPEAQQIPMRVGPAEATMLVSIKPEWQKFLNHDGSMYVKILGGLYGLPQAALLWHEHLKATLAAIGYRPCEMDPSTFIKLGGGKRSILVIHVDDIFHVTDMEGAQALLVQTLTSKYGPPTMQEGDSGVFIGIEYQFNRRNHSVRLTMIKHVDKILAKHAISKGSRSPASVNFLEIDESPRIPQNNFASTVMSLYFMAQRVRPDLLFPVTFMTTRITACNETDEKKLIKLLRYLFATRTRGIVLRPTGTRLIFAIDASYNILPRSRSAAGLHVTLGSISDQHDLDRSLPSSETGPVFFRCNILKQVSTSSFEAELNAVHLFRGWVLTSRQLLAEFGFNQDEPSLILQDNGATLLSLRRGRVFHGRSTAIDMRYYKQHEYQIDGILVFGRSSSDDIASDPLTKPMTSTKDQPKLARICNDTV